MSGRRVPMPVFVAPSPTAGIVDVLTDTTGLVPPVPAGRLDVDAARELSRRIRTLALTVRDRVERLRQMLEQARDGQAWEVLGFASWTAYLADVLGDEPMRLGRAERREVVAFLTGEGMSTRAIAPIVAADQKTISNDRRAIAAAASTGEESSSPTTVTGLDGKAYTAPRPHLAVVPDPTAPTTTGAVPTPLRAVLAGLRLTRAESQAMTWLEHTADQATQEAIAAVIAKVRSVPVARRA